MNRSSARVFAVAALAIMVLAGARPARAICAKVQVHVTPPSGTPLPARARLVLVCPFCTGPAGAGIEVVVDGQAVKTTWQRLGVSPAYAVDAVALDLRPGQRVVVKHGDQQLASYPVTATPAKSPAPPVVTAASRSRTVGTCSHEDAWWLVPSTDALAYRLDWAPSAAAWVAGQRHTVVLARNAKDLFWWRSAPKWSAAAALGVGHLNCMAATAMLPAGAFGQLIAYHQDRSTVIGPATQLVPPAAP